ncbi:hypothetical protein V6Z11_D12G227600 [Gossypium hirsutum]
MNECCSSLLWVSYNFRLCYLLHAYEDDIVFAYISFKQSNQRI